LTSGKTDKAKETAQKMSATTNDFGKKTGVAGKSTASGITAAKKGTALTPKGSNKALPNK